MQPVKQHLNVVIIGHVEAGKSTLSGHLVYKLGGEGQKLPTQITQTEEGKEAPSIKYAWIMDTLKAERERGITIDISHRKFQTQKYRFTLIDTPGHRDFIKNMITGTSQADCVLLVIAAPPGSFQTGISEEGQTREHALLAYTLGVKQMIVAINKMDDPEVNFSKDRYNFVTNEVSVFLKKVGFNNKTINFVPISALKGDNIFGKSTNTPWYQGPTLVEALDLMVCPKRPTDKPLRIPVQDVYNIGGIGVVPVGRIQSGILKPGMTVIFAPGGFSSQVKSIEMHKESLAEAIAGDNVGFNLKTSSPNSIRKGYVAGDIHNDPPKEVQSFLAQVIILNHPGLISPGYTPIVDCHTTHIACKFQQFLSKLDRSNGQVLENDPKNVKSGDCAMIVMKPTKPMSCQPFTQHPPLGRFAVRDLRKTVAVGVIKKCQKKNPKNENK